MRLKKDMRRGRAVTGEVPRQSVCCVNVRNWMRCAQCVVLVCFNSIIKDYCSSSHKPNDDDNDGEYYHFFFSNGFLISVWLYFVLHLQTFSQFPFNMLYI